MNSDNPHTEAKRFYADSPALLWVSGVGVGLLFLFASIVSYAGLYAIAPWLGLPPVLYWAFPLAVDLAIVVYKVAEVILRNDPTKTAKVKKAVFGTILFTAISSAGNVIHVTSLADPDPLHRYGGTLFAGIMPWAVYLAASVLTDLIVRGAAQEDERPLIMEKWGVSVPKEELIEGIMPMWNGIPLATDISVEEPTRARPSENFFEETQKTEEEKPELEPFPWQ